MDLISLFIACVVLFLGIPIGNILAKQTSDELKEGQKYFRTIIVIALLSSVASMIVKNDYLLFSFLFIAIVTSRSLKR